MFCQQRLPYGSYMLLEHWHRCWSFHPHTGGSVKTRQTDDDDDDDDIHVLEEMFFAATVCLSLILRMLIYVCIMCITAGLME